MLKGAIAISKEGNIMRIIGGSMKMEIGNAQ